MYTYTLISGGYQILKNGVVVSIQPHNPATLQPYTEAEAILEAEKYIEMLSETTSVVNYKTLQEKKIRALGAEKLNAIASPYAPEERDTWPVQVKEAEEYLLNNTASTPMLDAIASGRQITKEDLIEKIMINTNLFTAASGQVLGTQQLLLDQLAALPENATAEEVSAINWS